MKAILIDDERHALLQLKWMLDKEPDIEVIGSYQNAAEGLLHLSRERAELVFLDMEMPGMNGLEMAEAIASLDGSVRVIFVTAYSSYALEAFRVNALDYLLKPIDPDRFAQTLGRIRKTIGSAGSPGKESPLLPRPEIKLFGQLSIRNSTGQSAVKWRTLKAKELFAYLLQHQGVWLTKEVLIEEIWPAFAPDKALVHLHTSVYQVRRMLRDASLDAALDFSLESYRLQGEGLVTDAEQFQRAADATAVGQWDAAEASKAWDLYLGHYLDKEDYHWAKSRREALLQAYVALTVRLTSSERAAGAVESALRRARRACELHPYSERLVRERLACLAAVGDTGGLHNGYEAYCRLMMEEYGIEPSADFLLYVQRLIEGTH